jgi:hypothetical protein
MAEEMIDANTEFTAFVESCSDSDWRTVCRAEKWRVGVVAHHVAWGHERAADWVNAIRRGIPIPGSPQAHSASNAIKAAQVAGMHRNEVIFLARRNVERLVAVLRSLTDEDFDARCPSVRLADVRFRSMAWAAVISTATSPACGRPCGVGEEQVR